MKNMSTKLRELLTTPGIKVAPAVYDCIGAKLAEQVGFEYIFSSGFGIAASRFGLPDFGYLTATEMLTANAAIAGAIDIPLIGDLDTGYGNPLNVIRSVRDAVAGGLGGIILEDQQWPKKCGHFAGKQIISSAEHIEKIKAAVFARGDSELVIIARTDARAQLGLDKTLQRAEKYYAAGADVLFIEAPLSLDELTTIGSHFKEVPLMANIIEGGKTPNLTSKDLEKLGFNLAAFALSGLFSATKAIRDCFTFLHNHGTTGSLKQELNFSEFEKIIGVEHHGDLERRFTPSSILSTISRRE